MFSGAWLALSIVWLIQAVYGAVKPLVTVLLLRRQRGRFEEKGRRERLRPAVLIVAAKGVTLEFPRFLELVTHQDYPEYRLLFVTESEDDPAMGAMRGFLGLRGGESRWQREEGEGGLREVRLVVAGASRDCGQKVHNQQAAFREMEPGDEIVAFADADIVGERDWLRQLVMPLNLGEGDLSTGYRWFFPRRATFANAIATNINAGIATMTGPAWHTLLWGGSMAMTRACFEELEVPALLRGSLNDDLAISAAARRKGKQIRFVRSLMAASPVDYTWSGLFEFGRRQYFQLRVYVPGFWWTALVFTTLWCLAMGWNWVALFRGNGDAAWVIGAVVGLDGLRSLARTRYLRELFTEDQRAQLAGVRRWEWWTTWLHALVHWCVILSSFPIREITWAGIRYRVRGPREVTVVTR